MPKTKQHILSERPLQQPQTAEERQVTRGEVEGFLTVYKNLDRTERIQQFYQQKLRKFYQDLPADKPIRYRALENWREKLLREDYATSTVNPFLSTANTFLDYIGHREYQLVGQLREETPPQPELSRAEYLHLLQTTKTMRKDLIYFLMKVFSTVGILVQDLHELTVEAVLEGKVVCRKTPKQQILTVPKCLQKELLSFTDRNEIRSEPVFLTRDSSSIHRTYISGVMKPVCEAVRLADGRANPKGLQKLYLSIRAVIENNIAPLVEQEQFSIGWEKI